MKTIHWTLNTAALAALTFAAGGCTLDVHTHPYEERTVVVAQPRYEYHPDHVVVYEAPPRDAVVVVQEAPPPVYREVVPASPGPDFIWISGNWVVSGRSWVWVHGHYDRRPHHDAVWVSGNWDHHGDHYEYHEGHWH